MEGLTIQGTVLIIQIILSFMSFNMSNPILFLDRLHKTSPNPPKYSTILLWPLTKDVLRNNYWRNETSTCHRQPKNGNNTEQLVNITSEQ